MALDNLNVKEGFTVPITKATELFMRLLDKWMILILIIRRSYHVSKIYNSHHDYS